MRAPEAASWALSQGRSALTTDELATLLGVPADQVRRRLNAPARRGEWVTPTRGLWIPIPPEYRTWGAPPGIDIVDDVMHHLDISYYVGWLSAAALYGAAHQAPQVFQVGVARQMRNRVVGRTRFQFFIRRSLGDIPVISHRTPSGTARVSTPAATALDVATDVLAVGGLDNAATVIIELAEHDEFSIDELVQLAPLFPIASVRRVGWVLEQFTSRHDLEPLRAAAVSQAPTPSRLNPTIAPRGEIDSTWRISVNDEIEEES